MRIRIQKGFLVQPTDPAMPIVCVGPGTGIAPMRALIEQRVHEGATGMPRSQAMNRHLLEYIYTLDNTLYYGCRSESKDHHYSSEWLSLSSSGKLVYRTAFSRDVPEGVKRVYVQDRMREDAERLWDILGRRGGWLYISGYVSCEPSNIPKSNLLFRSSNKMPASVKDAVAYSAERAGGLTEEQAKVFVKKLQDEGRLFEECWS